MKGVHLLLWSQEVAVDAASFHRCWRKRKTDLVHSFLALGLGLISTSFFSKPYPLVPLHRQLPANGDGRPGLGGNKKSTGTGKKDGGLAALPSEDQEMGIWILVMPLFSSKL